MKKMTMDRISCHVTAKCNLRCKMCAVYIPKLYEMGDVPEYKIEDIKNSFSAYFEMVEHVRLISITGGETMIYSHLAELLDYLKQYENQFTKLEVFTNGTLLIPEKVLQVMAKSPQMTLFVDNYGSDISKRVDDIEKQCKDFGVKYTVRKYYGKDAHLGGWVDRSILSERLSNEQAKEHSQRCVVGKIGGRLFTIFGKKLVFCATPYCGYRIGAVPAEDVLGIEIGDEYMSMDEKYDKLVEMCNVEFNPGCAWCNGLGIYENVERYIPGEQVDKNE